MRNGAITCTSVSNSKISEIIIFVGYWSRLGEEGRRLVGKGAVIITVPC